MTVKLFNTANVGVIPKITLNDRITIVDKEIERITTIKKFITMFSNVTSDKKIYINQVADNAIKDINNAVLKYKTDTNVNKLFNEIVEPDLFAKQQTEKIFNLVKSYITTTTDYIMDNEQITTLSTNTTILSNQITQLIDEVKRKTVEYNLLQAQMQQTTALLSQAQHNIQQKDIHIARISRANAQLQADIASKDTKLARLQRGITTLQRKLRAITIQANALSARNGLLTTQNAALSASLTVEQQQSAALAASLAAEQKQNTALAADILTEQQQSAALLSSYRQAVSDLNASQLALERVKQRYLTIIKNINTDRNKLKALVASTKVEYEEKIKVIAQEHKREIDKLEANFNTVHNKFKAYISTIHKLHINGLNELCAFALKSIASGAKYDRVEGVYQLHVDELNKFVYSISNEHPDRVSSAIQDIINKLDNALIPLTPSIHPMKIAEGNIHKLNQENDANKALASQYFASIQEYAAELKQKEAELAQLNQAHTDKLARLNQTHTAELDRLNQSHAAELKQKEAELAQLKDGYAADLKQKEAELAQIKQEHVAALKQKEAELAQIKQEHVAALKQKEDELARLNQTHAAELARLNQTHAAELARLNQSHAAELAQLKDGYAAELAQLKDGHAAELARLNQTHAAKEDELKQKEDEIKKKEANLPDLTEWLTNLSEKYTADAQRLSENYESKVDTIKQHFSQKEGELRKRISDLEEKNKELNTRNGNISTQLQETKHTLEECQRKSQTIHSQLIESEAARSTIAEEKSRLDDELTIKKNEIAMLQEEIRQLKASPSVTVPITVNTVNNNKLEEKAQEIQQLNTRIIELSSQLEKAQSDTRIAQASERKAKESEQAAIAEADAAKAEAAAVRDKIRKLETELARIYREFNIDNTHIRRLDELIDHIKDLASINTIDKKLTTVVSLLSSSEMLQNTQIKTYLSNIKNILQETKDTCDKLVNNQRNNRNNAKAQVAYETITSVSNLIDRIMKFVDNLISITEIKEMLVRVDTLSSTEANSAVGKLEVGIRTIVDDLRNVVDAFQSANRSEPKQSDKTDLLLFKTIYLQVFSTTNTILQKIEEDLPSIQSRNSQEVNIKVSVIRKLIEELKQEDKLDDYADYMQLQRATFEKTSKLDNIFPKYIEYMRKKYDALKAELSGEQQKVNHLIGILSEFLTVIGVENKEQMESINTADERTLADMRARIENAFQSAKNYDTLQHLIQDQYPTIDDSRHIDLNKTYLEMLQYTEKLKDATTNILLQLQNLLESNNSVGTDNLLGSLVTRLQSIINTKDFVPRSSVLGGSHSSVLGGSHIDDICNTLNKTNYITIIFTILCILLLSWCIYKIYLRLNLNRPIYSYNVLLKKRILC